MSPTRRDVMKAGLSWGAAGLAGVAPQLSFGQPNVDGSVPPTLVVVYLRGGCDPLNAIVPYGDTRYRSARPTIAVPGPDAAAGGVIPLSSYFGFHPAMAELADLYKRGLMCPILNTGSTHPTRSHFDAQDFMERAAPGIKSVTEGWLNRYLYATKQHGDAGIRAVSLQSTLPRSLRGQYAALAVPGYGADHVMDTFADLYDCDSNKEARKKNHGGPAEADAAAPLPEEQMRQRIAEAGDQGIAKLRELNQLVENQRQLDGYPDTRLGRQFRDIAKLIKSRRGLEVAAVDYGGWDHHAFQGGSRGTMANMLGNLSKSIGRFIADLGPDADRTLVLTMSEFGRTVRENGNSGTDHGRASCMFAVGGMVNGGKIYGKWTGMESRSLVDGRDMKVHTDFRRVFAETLASLYGFEADEHDFFPEYKSRAKPVGFLRRVGANA